jgi:hypothetical protein
LHVAREDHEIDSMLIDQPKQLRLLLAFVRRADRQVPLTSCTMPGRSGQMSVRMYS